MEENNYWNLFWQTGLPVAWLLSCVEGKPEAAAAFASDEGGGTQA